MNILIQSVDLSIFSLNDVLLLIKTSFQERLEQGLIFECSVMSLDQFEKEALKGFVFVAVDEDTKQLIGTMSIHFYVNVESEKYGNVEYLAVHPNFRKKGVARQMLSYVETFAKKNDCLYLLSDTAVGAKSSIKWHVCNGFAKIELKSYNVTDYYSILFRKNLVPSKKWDNCFYTFFIYFKSCISKRLCYRPNGRRRAWFDWFVCRVRKK